MNFRELKILSLDKISQFIVFNEDGEAIESDENLFKVDKANFNLFRDTFFCGMEDTLFALKLDQELKFECVSTKMCGYDSQFDFVLTKKNSNSNLCYILLIYDFKDQYDKIFELQQERNVAEIKKHKLEKKHLQVVEEKQTIEKLYKEALEGGELEYVLIRTENIFQKVDMKDIYFLEAYGDYVKFHTSTKIYLTHNTLKKVEDSLPKDKFSRIHRSYIIRLDKVINIEQMSLQIQDKILPIGKSYKMGLLDKMKLL